MNEIQKLAEKAKKSVPQGILGVDKWIEAYNEKFAELIINKCANIVWDEAEKKMNTDVNDAGYKIIQHFYKEQNDSRKL